MIVLASQSASRKAMLEAVGVPFEARPAQVDERRIEAEMADARPEEVAIALAKEKALAVSREMPGRLVLGSDSLVVVAGRRFDKPASRFDAASHLKFFAGKTMRLVSAAALVRNNAVVWSEAAHASLHVRELSDAFIESYLDAEWPAVAGCVGVFRVEARGAHLFENIEGDQCTALGMLVLQVLSELCQQGELAA